MIELTEDKIDPWVKDNVRPGLFAPYVGSCIQAALIKVQESNSNAVELSLQALWSILDREVIAPAMLQEQKPQKDPSFAAYAVYLALVSYFKFRGDFRKGLQADLELFRQFGVAVERLKECIEKVAVPLSKDLLQISAKTTR